MDLVVGRDASRCDVNVPPHFTAVSRVHARISSREDGDYVIEDLNSSGGTFIKDAQVAWRRVNRAAVKASTPILLANYQTTVGELLSQTPTSALSIPPASAGPEPALKPSDQDADSRPVELLLKMVGLGDLLRILSTLHAPLRGIRRLISEDQKPLYQSLLAYAAFLGVSTPLHREVTMVLGKMVHYPIVAQGPLVENSTVLHIVAVLSGVLGFLVMYSLPRSLFAPTDRTLVVATNIYMNLYFACYMYIADWIKMGLFAATGEMTLPIILGLAMMILNLIFCFYVWRAMLKLRWGLMTLMLIIGLVMGFAQGFILGAAGLVKLG
jgi:hypothetical protein